MAEGGGDIGGDITSITDAIKGLKVHWVSSHPECSVCLQQCLQPVQLPCTHIFCFLCVKGFVYRSKKCALCRREVDLDYFVDPVVVKVKVAEENGESSTACAEERDTTGNDEETVPRVFQWFYEGRNGWWQYDDRASLVLEETFKTEIRTCEIIIAGFTYVVDFENMVQYRKNNPTRCRRVKRDRSGADRKGVAGLQLKSVQTQVCNVCNKLFNDEEIYMNKCLNCTRSVPMTRSRTRAVGQEAGQVEVSGQGQGQEVEEEEGVANDTQSINNQQT